METDHRPWGYFTVLSDEPDHKVKRICVFPGKRLSLQRHRRRSEHWYLVCGEAVATVDDREIALRPGDAADIPCGAAHRLRNVGEDEAVFIEVQTGEYFGEDDIERIADDYGRV
jgi:mannose-6-phosphate isomerase